MAVIDLHHPEGVSSRRHAEGDRGGGELLDGGDAVFAGVCLPEIADEPRDGQGRASLQLCLLLEGMLVSGLGFDGAEDGDKGDDEHADRNHQLDRGKATLDPTQWSTAWLLGPRWPAAR